MWEKIGKFIQNNWPIWLLVVASMVVYFKWFSFGVFTNGDYWFSFSESVKDYLHYSTWNSQANLGSPNLVLWMLGFKFFSGIWGFFGFNSNVYDKFLFFWPFIFFTPIFAYLFVKEVVANKTGAFIGACVYAFSTYYLAINTQGHFSLTLAGAFVPLTMLFFWRYFKNGKVKNLIISALCSLLIIAYDFRVFYILFFMLVAIPFWFLLMQSGIEKKKIFFWQNFWPMVLFFGSLFLLNLFWIWPTVMTGSLLTNEVVSRGLVPNNYYLDLGKSLTLFHPFWNGSEPRWFHEQKIPFYFWLIPIMVAVATFWARKDKRILFWALVALLAVFLSKQEASPIEDVYAWLHSHFPGFNAFREASKFYFAILLAYAVLIGYFVKVIQKENGLKRMVPNVILNLIQDLISRFRIKPGMTVLFAKYTITFLIAGIFLWNAKPILTGEMYEIFTPREIPVNNLSIRENILKQKPFSRTLLVSYSSKFMTYSNAHPVISDNSLRETQWNGIIDLEGGQGDGLGGSEKVALFLSHSFATNVLSQSGIASVIVEDKDFFQVSELVKNSAWEEINWDVPETRVFKNKTVKPRIYLTEKRETIYQTRPFQTIDFSSKNPARWNITLSKLENQSWLNFSESYHPNWRLVCGDFRWHDTFSHKKTFSEKNHYETDAGLSAFWLDKTEWQDVCEKKDGQDVRLSLFYLPQAYLYLGGIISLVTIIVSLLVLVFWREKGDNKKDV